MHCFPALKQVHDGGPARFDREAGSLHRLEVRND